MLGPRVRGLSAGGSWIRTSSSAARKPRISGACRHRGCLQNRQGLRAPTAASRRRPGRPAANATGRECPPHREAKDRCPYQPSSGSKTSTMRKLIAGSARPGASKSALQVLLQPRHQLDEIARPKPVVELVHEDAFPGVAAGARRARQGEQIGAARDPRRRAVWIVEVPTFS